MLGFAWGMSPADAIANLLRENPWIEAAGFSAAGIVAARVCGD